MLKCKYAWSHLDFLQGEYAPCFRFKIKQQPIASMSDTLPSEAINHDNMVAVRQSLQSGEFPAGCSDCAYKEHHGIKSYRQKSLDNQSWDDSKIDYGSSTVDRLLDLELKFSRTCNYFCRHCMADSNSQFEVLGKKNPEIDSELQKVGFDHIGRADSPIQTISIEHQNDIIQNLVGGLQKITFSGGEPLYHLGHYKFLERLITDPTVDTSQLIIAYNTNMSMITFKHYEVADLWQHFAGVELTVSMDGTGELFNYFREGGDYLTIVDNLFQILKATNNVLSVQLVCTSTAYHAFYADDIFDDLNELAEQIRHMGIDSHVAATFVHYPVGLDVANLEQIVKDRLIKIMRTDNPIIQYMKTPQSADSALFKKIVRLQDKLYSKSCETTLPRIYEYVYNDITRF
tara:strand:- start:3025 stop:4227 length:1203 start_codon:yes stop_codon:yes gene_type:complete